RRRDRRNAPSPGSTSVEGGARPRFVILRPTGCRGALPQRMAWPRCSSYNEVLEGSQTRWNVQGGTPITDTLGRGEGVVRSDLDPADESFGPAYAGELILGTPARIYLVGTMRAVAPDGGDILPRGRKTRGLLACLCLAQGDRVSRSRLVGLFW